MFKVVFHTLSKSISAPHVFMSAHRLFSSNLINHLLVLGLFVASLCGSAVASTQDQTAAAETIRINQVGYHPQARKIAIVSASGEKRFSVIDTASKDTVLTAELDDVQQWPVAATATQQADFSQLTKPGRYQLKVGKQLSHTFSIDESVLADAHDAALKSFYFIRSGMDIDAEYAGEFARKGGHWDTKVKVHQSAATKARPAGTVLASPKGWYDAGDFGKYVVNSGITTYTLLLAWDHYQDFYTGRRLGIPESPDSVPDILNEIKWNLDWLETMQDLDGGVYHKLTTLNFAGMTKMPAEEDTQRYIIGKTTTATLNFAAVMAKASRIYAAYETAFPGLSERYTSAAEQAYNWAKQHPDSFYQQPKDVRTGPYDDTDPVDEFALAEIELFLTTAKESYWQSFKQRKLTGITSLAWPRLTALSYLAVLNAELDKALKASYLDEFIAAADTLVEEYRQSAYAVPAARSDFEWGSNSNILNNGIVLMQAYRSSGNTQYRDAALATLDYVLGSNATGYSFVTAYGAKTPMHLHNRLTTADKNEHPIPGLIAGGPQNGKQDKCDYPSDKPAETYADIVCSYSTNETAINWNAPLVYMLAAALNAF